MVDQAFIGKIVNEQLQELDLFLVDINISAANKIDVTIDGDNGVGIDKCVAVSRAVEGSLDREQEDFELNVSSPGIGQPFKVFRQYQKAIGRNVEVTKTNGEKVEGRIVDVTPDSVEVAYSKKVLIEGTKKKQTVEVNDKIAFSDIKTTNEVVSFK